MSYIKSYLKYIRQQDDKIKNFHALVITGFITFLFAVVYLYLVRGIAPPMPGSPLSQERTFNSENFPVTATTQPAQNTYDRGPFDTLVEIYRSAKETLEKIDTGIGTSEYRAK